MVKTWGTSCTRVILYMAGYGTHTHTHTHTHKAKRGTVLFETLPVGL